MILAERYQIIRPLAQGGFGKTFLASDRYLPTQPLCVIKQLFLENASPQVLKTAQRLFDLEAKTLYKLGAHPQIPALLAHFEVVNSQAVKEFYLVQEYIPGDSLQKEFEHIELSPSERISYTHSLLKDLLSLLAFVHQQGVIHRDLKPANIIRRDDQLVLIDFGAVKLLALKPTQQPSTVAIGSPGYMALEQQAGRPCFASDLYAVGVVALQALTGLAVQQLPVNPQTGQFKLESNADNANLLAFIERLTQRDPSDRFPHATAALKALEQSENNLISNSPPLPETHFPTHFPATTLPTPTPSQPASIPPSLYSPAADSPTDRRNRQALIDKVHRFWIQGVLEHSLHGQVLLTLGLEERAEAVTLPWNISWQFNRQTPSDQQPAQPLPADTQVFDVFQQLGEGKSLLILGEPGAGKTTTLLTLARDLLQALSATDRIPAIFNLSSWTEGPIAQWLITELNSKYQIPKAIGKQWVEQQQLLLLLDGLDEVRLDRRDRCTAAINQFHRDYGPELVVCCRIADYEALGERLGFQSAVKVRSLSDQQIWQYLDQAKTGLTGLKSLLKQKLPVQKGQSSLLALARSPLILNIMALTYQGVSAQEIALLTQAEGQIEDQTENYTHQLFSAYVARMFQRRHLSHIYSQEQTLRWLQALAINLEATSQTVFLIERMQPDWLTSRAQRWGFGALVWAVFLVTATLVGLQVIDPREIPLAVIICGILFVRMFGIYRIVPAETLRWSWRKASRSLLIGLTVGPLIGWALKVGFVEIFGDGPCAVNSECLRHTSLLGLAFGTVLGVTYGVIRGMRGDRIATHTQPNQGMRQSTKNALLLSIVAAITPLFIAHFLGNTYPAFWAAAGLSFGLALGGGEACIKHGILRLMLFCQGRIPWNYARFLNYAAERIFLQKVGGGYIFVHRLLLEHFAALK